MTSIRTRLLASLLATLALAALLLGTAAYRSVLAETERLFDYQLRQMALSLRDQGEIAPAQAGALVDADFDFVVQIWTVDGRTIYASRAHAELPSQAVLGFADAAVRGTVWRTYGVATSERVIQVAQPARIRQRLAARSAFGSVVPLLAVAPLLAAAVWWAVALAIRPLERVARAVRSRGADSMQPVTVDRSLPDEAAPLVDALNALLDRLARAFDAQRAFVADAAHELRSPLTALRLQAGRLRRLEAKGDDAPAREEALQALEAGVDRAVRLVEQLLALARSEAVEAAASPARLDLAEAARGAIAEVAAFAASRRIDVELLADAPVEVAGDAALLGVLVRNLVDNAARHAPEGSAVRVRVADDAGAALLTVDDAGPGIPAAERGRVFDRFYRRGVDDQAGSGLGLAIVQRIAARHGAAVALDDSPCGGLRVSVRFFARPA